MSQSLLAGPIYSDVDGGANIKLDSAAAGFLVYADKAGFTFNLDTITVLGADTIDVYGYPKPLNISLTPSGANLSVVYGYVLGLDQSIESWAELVFTPKQAANICDSAIILGKSITTRVNTTTGVFSQELPFSSCLGDSSKQYEYKVEVMRSGAVTREFDFAIPDDSSSYYLVF